VQRQVQLIRGANNTPVNAYLVELKQKHIDDYETLWKNQLRLHLQDDKFWDWAFKLRFILHGPNREGYAIELEGETQGLMSIETQLHGSRITEGKRLVYVEGIATAPWNRKPIQHPPRYKGIGTELLLFARIRSVRLGYKGRVGLHSLPGTEKFYGNQGMLNLDPDEDYENLVYFEYGVWRTYQQDGEG
jgi:hypothetical protein